MKQTDYTGNIPPQVSGKEIAVEHSITLGNNKEATDAFANAKTRLLNINNWHRLAGFVSATFELVDSNGDNLNRTALKDDYIRIDIPGPGSKEGDGFDWVKIEDITEINGAAVDAISIRVRPAANPTGNASHIAHFYDERSTSNFIIEREDNLLTARIIDRNTTPNDDANSFTDQLRHTVAGLGAIALFSKLQWNNLTEALVAHLDKTGTENE